MAQLSEGGSARARSGGSNGGQGGRTPVSVERLALQVDRAGHCLAAGNERSAARRLRRFWADYLSVVGQEAGGEDGGAAGSGTAGGTVASGAGAAASEAITAASGAGPDLAGRARRAREAGTVGDDLAEALAAFAASERENADDLVAATARLLDLTRSHLEGRVG